MLQFTESEMRHGEITVYRNLNTYSQRHFHFRLFSAIFFKCSQVGRFFFGQFLKEDRIFGRNELSRWP